MAGRQNVEWLKNGLRSMRENEDDAVGTTTDAEYEWTQPGCEAATGTLLPTANPGVHEREPESAGEEAHVSALRGRRAVYKQKCDEVAAQRYTGFQLH